MINILKILGSLSGTLGIIGIVTYFLFSVGINDVIKLDKAAINTKVLKSFASLIFGTYIFFILFIAILIFIFFPQILGGNVFMPFEDCLTIIYLIIYLFVMFNRLNKIKKFLYEKNTYTTSNTKGIYVFFMIIIVFASVCAVIFDSLCVGFLDNIKTLISGYSNKEAMRFIIIVAQISFNYISMILLNGYIHGINVLKNLPQYIISSDAFENNRVIGYILAENKEEVMLKCNESYPIIIKKENIDGYLLIPSNVKIDEDKEKIKIKIPTKKHSIAIILYRLLTERSKLIKIVMFKFKGACTKQIKWIFFTKRKIIKYFKNCKNMPEYKEIDYDGYMVKFNDMSNKSEELNKK